MTIRSRAQILMLALAATPQLAHAHTGRAIEPHDLWSAWTFEPVVVALLVISLFAFFRGMNRQRLSLGRSPDNSKGRTIAFVLGWMALAISLVSPVHALGGALFAAHMAQHELLMTIAAPLLILSRPYPVFLWSLSEKTRSRVGRAIHERIASPLGFLASPLAAWLLHALAIWIWHAPKLYGATLTSEWIHTAQHVSFMGTALLFWWCVFPVGRERSPGAALLYLFTTAIHTGTLGALLTFSSSPWYIAYGNASEAWGLMPLDDQQLGGMIMWIPGGLAYLAAALWIAARMLSVSEARALRTGLAVLLIAFVAGCKSQHESNEKIFTSADPDHGKALIRKYGCPACHVIPGIAGADGLVGPPLRGIASRVYIAGVVPNSPDAMVIWLQHPQVIDPLTAMPDVGVTPSDAQDIAAYLYTLR
jgi:cytochrome c oxidase assembly factor CtaG